MNKDNFISKFIAFYKNKKGKAICFFGFYFFFFLFVGILINTNKGNIDNTNPDSKIEEETLYSTTLLENNNYEYQYIIDCNEKKEFSGTRDEENNLLNDYEYNYFLDLYNIKQLIKNSKYLSTTTFKDNTMKLDYEIDNDTLNRYFEHEYQENLNNTITISTDENKNVTGFTLDLSNFFNEKMLIKINYKVGESDV